MEFATLEWVDSFSHRRLLEPIGHMPLKEYERQYYQAQETLALWPESGNELSGTTWAGSREVIMRANHQAYRARAVCVLLLVLMVLGLDRPAAQSPSGAVRDAFVDIPGVRLFYRDSGGAGVPVVFLHAYTADSRGWEHQVPVFTAAGYRFIAFDRRGWGQSVINETGPQPGTAVDDLVALLDHLKVDRVHLVGTGGGGFVALDAALSISSRLRSVVAACTQGGIQYFDQQFQDIILARLRSPEFDKLSVEFHELSPSYRAANPEGTRRWLEKERASRVPGGGASLRALRNRITLAQLGTIEVPLRFIAGGADLYAPPPLMRLLAARVKHSEFAVVPEAGHSAYWEEPDLFNNAVLTFIKKH